MRLSRRMVLGGLLATAATPVLAAPPATSIRPAPRAADFFKRAVPLAEDLVARAKLGGKVSFAVADARTGELLETRAPILPQPPASTAKTLTALYALDALGADHRFATRLVATGPVENGRLDGDLILVGGGDPTLDTDGLAEMAAQLKATGLHEITGRFGVWNAALPALREIDPEQPDHVGYNPALGGLNLNFNRVHFGWKRAGKGYDVSMDARSARYRPDVTMARMRVIDRRAPVYTFADNDGRDDWTVARAALGTGGARWLPVRRPDLYAGEVFQTLARAHGIQLDRAVQLAALPEGTTLVRHLSPDMATMLRDMLKYSTNLTAEVMGLTASQRRGGPVRSLVDSAARMNAWLAEAHGAKSARLIDHSGLGDDSRITAADMVRTMVAAGPDGPLRPLLKTYPVEDRPGVTVHAKTGTLNFVSALTGYIAAPGKDDLAFAIFCSDIPRRDALSEAEMERPAGGAAWNGRARRLQGELLSRWSTVYAA